jgi:beta-lactamase superfamily II metal-dependent hydrolase
MEILTLYVGQGSLVAIRSGTEALIVDSHMPTADDVTQEQIEQTLATFVGARRVRGLILTGFDDDHSCPAGVESILTTHTPDWVMYPKYYKPTDAATDVFATITREEKRRANSLRPLVRHSVRVDLVATRHLLGLAGSFTFELFSPHMEDMDSSNNSSLVLKVTGLDATGFSYLITGDTETGRWERINAIFGAAIRSDKMAASHHGSITGVNAESLLLISPHTVLISAGHDNQYGHPDTAAIKVYSRVAQRVYSTHVDGGHCLFSRRVAQGFETHLVRHADHVDSGNVSA